MPRCFSHISTHCCVSRGTTEAMPTSSTTSRSRASLQREEPLQQPGDLVAGAVPHGGHAPLVDHGAARPSRRCGVCVLPTSTTSSTVRPPGRGPRSIQGARVVSAPTEMTSTPASASSRTRSRRTPPETSTTARPATRATAWRTAGVHVVEQHDGRAAGERLVQLLERVDLDLEGVQVRGAGAYELDRGGDAAGRRDVVVLDHRAVEQAEAVRRAAAVHHGLLLEGAQAGRGLARRGDARLSCRRSRRRTRP